MANWKFTLDISKIWNDKEISVQDKGKAIANELKVILPKEWWDKEYDHNNNPDLLNDDNIDFDLELSNIINWFLEMDSYSGHSIVNEFNGIMECLYDWADQEVRPFGQRPRNAMCWIKTQDHM